MDITRLPDEREAAAQLIAHGGMEKQKIATQIGISRGTLWNWEQTDDFKARVEELRHEFGNFATGLIHSKLVDAVEGYWRLIKDSDNDMVRAKGYEYFLNRNLGKPTDKHEITTKQDTTANVSDDLLDIDYDNVIDMPVDEDDKVV